MSSQGLPTMVDWLCKWEVERADHVYLRQPYGDTWKTITYQETGIIVRKMISAMRAMGLQPGDHVGLLSKNCYHWILADLAIMMGGYVSVPLYFSLGKSALEEVIAAGDIKGMFIGKLESWGAKGEAIPAGMPTIHFPPYKDHVTITDGASWDELLAQHEPAQDLKLPKLEDTWKILFTSGTTGTPKGAVFDYAAPSKFMEVQVAHPEYNLVRPDFASFSYLPLNHIAETIGCHVITLFNGGTISFAETIDTFPKNLQDTQPKTFGGVPRIYARFMNKILETLPQKRLNTMLAIPIVSGMIKSRIKNSLGMTEAKMIFTGAAITPPHIKAFFKRLGINVIELYGTTEVLGAVIVGDDPKTPLDAVGKPLPTVKMKTDPETDEIMLNVPFGFKGYYKDPQKTSEVLSEDGWYRTGDRGHIDENGFLKIVGRVKDAFKTAKGKFIVPNPLETQLEANEYLDQVCVAGITSSQPIALANLTEAGYEADRAEVEASLTLALDELNANLQNYTKISTLVITRLWTVENELITPTLKMRRGKLDDAFKEQYEAWNTQGEKVIWVI